MTDQAQTEDAKDGIVVQTEKEITIYGELTNPAGLSQAFAKEIQIQAEIKQGEGRRIRVRYTKDGKGETYEMTAKVQTGDDMARTMEEKTATINKEAFDLFLSSCHNYQKKIRYFFHVESASIKDGKQELKISEPGLKYEVDVFVKDGKESTWCKVDVEVQDLEEYFVKAGITPEQAKYTVKLSSLPIGIKNAFVMNAATSQEDKDKLTKIYDEQFLSYNFGEPEVQPEPQAAPEGELAEGEGEIEENEEPVIPEESPEPEAKAEGEEQEPETQE